jgi:hypothetical protein
MIIHVYLYDYTCILEMGNAYTSIPTGDLIPGRILCIHIQVYIFVYTYMYMYLHIYIYIYICIYICILLKFIHI